MIAALWVVFAVVWAALFGRLVLAILRRENDGT